MSNDPLLDEWTYAEQLEKWLAEKPAALVAAAEYQRVYADRVERMRTLMGALFEAGWNRYGWPVELGGLGGSIVHRGVMWEALGRHGLDSMAVFEHCEVLAPTLAHLGKPAFVAEVLPKFLAGEIVWCQGFSEPESGSDLPSLRTKAEKVDDGYVITGRKIWTSWAKYADWCLVLARTGPPESRHRGITAFAVDMRDPGIQVRPLDGANGTDELAEVTFDSVHVPEGRIVGEVDGGWAVAMHILSHERGTYGWFRHAFLYSLVAEATHEATERDDVALGNAWLDLASCTAAASAAIHAHADQRPLGPKAAYTKLLLCAAEQSVCDWSLMVDPEIALDPSDDLAAARREEYLFSRIVTVYGGSQQMQLETIANQILRLPR